MQCKKCSLEMTVEQGEYVSELNSTEVYSKLIYKCTNPQCDNCKNEIKEVQTIKIN